MVYHPKSIRGLAITQIVIGGVCIIMGIGIFFIYTNWRLQYIQDGAFGLWAGAWVSKHLIAFLFDFVETVICS